MFQSSRLLFGQKLTGAEHLLINALGHAQVLYCTVQYKCMYIIRFGHYHKSVALSGG